MGVPDNSLNDLERQRLELEDNIAKLQQSLYHWRTWEAEYDALKEKINELDDLATGDDFLEVGHSFEGILVTDDEVRAMIGEKQGFKRTKRQVIDIISRRIDYVQNNVSTMEKRVRAAEKQLHDLESLDQIPDEPTADFPMKEIIEELDEDGEVISSSTTTPGDQASDLLEILRQAGVQDIPNAPKPNPQTAVSESPSISESTIKDTPALKDQKEQNVDVPQHEAILPTSADSTTPEAQTEVPVVDIDESAEDAKLRRDMILYGLDEVGAVVAELELDEDTSDFSVDDEYDFSYDDEDNEEEEEDEFGRTRPVLDEDYHQKMRELEAKLNARGLWNAGKDVQSLPEDVKEDLEQPHVVKVEKSFDSKDGSIPDAKPKKKVAFSDELDIAPAPKHPAPERESVKPRQSEVAVLLESIVERTQAPETNDATPDAPPRKVSRFKTARGNGENNTNGDSTVFTSRSADLRSAQKPAAVPSSSLPLFPARPPEPKPFSQPISDVVEKPTSPNPPQDKLVVDTLVERDRSESGVAPPEPEELDEQLHRKEIATEFYRLRNRMIQQDGGFLDDEQEMVPVETEDPPKRVSKFKAARMR